ncbi:hypothetical protein AVEN_29444-1 [Araneus ventricosus]|uniref:Uncharacterized protein n=1 Tax=Araneus ventricosus TaxID=182803 RepID=A0A4Y2D0H4_ARAVE|nr:hypothetical protein AVEN_29444-1 [Araneus ventricosus]
MTRTISNWNSQLLRPPMAEVNVLMSRFEAERRKYLNGPRNFHPRSDDEKFGTRFLSKIRHVCGQIRRRRSNDHSQVWCESLGRGAPDHMPSLSSDYSSKLGGPSQNKLPQNGILIVELDLELVTLQPPTDRSQEAAARFQLSDKKVRFFTTISNIFVAPIRNGTLFCEKNVVPHGQLSF